MTTGPRHLPADVLDRGYQRLHGFEPEYGGGLADHAPMVIEALAHAGRVDRIDGWLDSYVGRLERRTAAPRDSAVDDSAAGAGSGPRLGDHDAYWSWVGRAEAELLAADAWEPVAAAWVERLADGAIAAAGHGVLRTSHAVRALAAHDTEARRTELARGLGYWAACHQRLPGEPDPRGGADPAEALAGLTRLELPPSNAWLISDRVAELDRAPGFADAVNALAADALAIDPIVDAVAPLAIAGAGSVAIVYVHAITVPSAVAAMAPLLPLADPTRVVRYAWQAVAALVAAYPVASPGRGTAGRSGATGAVGEVLDAALSSGDEHAVKVAVAAGDVVVRSERPAVLDAAQALIANLHGG